MKQQTYYRHGDIHLLSGAEIPEGAIEEVGNKTVEWGEATGHAHRLDDGAGARIFKAPNGVRYLRAVGPTDLKHEEHQTRTIPPGTYEIRRTRETDHMEGVTRQVAD